MSHVLALTSSALGDGSVSRQLVDEAVAQLRRLHPAATVTVRDLDSDPVPHLSFHSATALRGAEPANGDQVAARDLSDRLVGELEQADTIVIGAPMYNFGIASTLKAWFDYVLRAGITFRYGESGPEGLLKGKRALVVLTRGGLYSEGPAQAMDSQEPHLRTLLQFIGIEDITFIRAEKLAFGPEAREEAVAAARAQIARAASTAERRAA